MKKKGQAAMEFLMTYGWAILVVLIAISALAYFGVLNPAKFLPESCVLLPGLSCVDHKVTSDSITLVIQNGLGQDLDNFVVSFGDWCNNAGSDAIDFSDANQETFEITDCDNGDTGDRFKADVVIEFTSQAGLTHTETGQLVTNVE
ncbi:hypothetical protein KY313_02210 [Candidatus Woesearchaeota archaeon]|nr:hypothetical protein [Candidatus Woesearchaeota archaeon]